jgi:hypothetical protein
MVTEEEHVAALRGLMQSEPETIQLLTDVSGRSLAMLIFLLPGHFSVEQKNTAKDE